MLNDSATKQTNKLENTIMSAKKNTTATAAPTVEAPKAKKQYTCGISGELKDTLKELRGDFLRPAAVKGAPDVEMTEKEALEVLHKVATDRRFKTFAVVDSDGNPVLDSDGQPVHETVDLFEKEWEAIKTRDYADIGSGKPTIDKLIAQARKYGEQLNMDEKAIQKLLKPFLDAKAANASA